MRTHKLLAMELCKSFIKQHPHRNAILLKVNKNLFANMYMYFKFGKNKNMYTLYQE